MADVKWIKLNVGMFDGNSFKKIKKAKIGGESFRDKLTAVWFELMDFAGKCNAGGRLIESPEIPFSNLEDIAILIDREPEELNLCMQYYINNRMITVIDDVYMLANWTKYQNEDGLEKIREQNRIRKQKQREREKLLLEVNMSRDTSREVTQQNKKEDTDKEKDINNTYCASDNAPKVSKSDINNFFESIWALYPNKKGKGQISDSKKKTLYDIGLEEMSRAIERYKTDLAKEDWRKPQNGSTFFNSGYVDYLDDNYTPLVVKSSNKFNNFNENKRQYDMDALERTLLARNNPPKPETDPEFLREAEALKKELQEKY